MLEVSPTGATISRTMDSRGNTLAEVDEEGHRTTYVFDALDRCIRETDPRGATTYRTYASTGRENAGPVTVEERQFNANERSRTEYSYNASGTLTHERQKLDATGWATTTYADFSLSGEAGTTTREDVLLETGGSAVDLTEHTIFDAFGNTLSRTNAAGVTTEESTYDLAGAVLTTEDATGTVTHHAYDTIGRETLTYRQATDGAWSDRTATAYDADGNALTETRYLADASGDPVADATVARTFDPMGRETASDDSKVTGSAVTRFDARGNATVAWTEGSDTAAPMASTRTTHDVYGRVTSELAPGAETASTVTTYFPDGQLKKTTDPDGTYTAYVYDEAGNVAAETTPAEGSNTVSTTRAYDVGGRMVAETSPEGDTTTGVFDLAGRQTQAAAEGAPATVTAYNTLGWRLSETDSDGVTKSWAYDVCGRTLAETTAGETIASTYDESGNTVEQANPDGSSIESEYDGFGRTKATTQLTTDDTVVSDLVTDYDAQDRLVEVTDAARDTTLTLDYAADGSVTSVRELAGVTTTTTTDSLGLRRAETVGTISGAAVTRSLAATDVAMRAVEWEMDGAAPVGVAYDEAGRLSVQDAIAPEGEGYTGGGIVPLGIPPEGVNYIFDAHTGRKVHDSFGFTFADRSEDTTYTYTPAGRIASVVTDLATTNYAFDLAGNLTGVRRPAETTTTLTYGSGNRLASMSGPAGTFAYGWDATKGWRTSAKRSGESSVTYSYTAGRLTSFADPNTSTAATFAYDATGQRVRSVVTEGSLTTTSTYVYEGLLLQRYGAERSDGTTSSVSYLFDEQDDPYAAIYESGEATPVVFTIIMTDRGGVRELLDSHGTSFAYYAYDAFGRPTEATTTPTASLDASSAAAIAGANPLRYAGYCYDGFSGLYYCSQRYYDPATAQFITKDSAKADGEESAYQYCGGDPVGKVDPSGLSYSPSRAISYALTWWNGYNTYYYPRWKLDCTNFMSQCLYAGGHAMNATWKVYKSWGRWKSTQYLECRGHSLPLPVVQQAGHAGREVHEGWDAGLLAVTSNSRRSAVLRLWPDARRMD